MYVKCNDVALKVSEIIDNEANLLTQIRFYSHLMMCSKCRRYYQQFKSVKEIAGAVNPDKLPEDFDCVMEFVMDEIEK